jgi:hypothetical protein
MMARRINTYLATLVLRAGYCSGFCVVREPSAIGEQSVDESLTIREPMLLSNLGDRGREGTRRPAS